MTEYTPSILLVDDDEDICENMADIFTDLGYQVTVAHDGKSALEMSQGRPSPLEVYDMVNNARVRFDGGIWVDWRR